MTLRGYSYITYRIYDWNDQAFSDYNRISLSFRVKRHAALSFVLLIRQQPSRTIKRRC